MDAGVVMWRLEFIPPAPKELKVSSFPDFQRTDSDIAWDHGISICN